MDTCARGQGLGFYLKLVLGDWREAMRGGQGATALEAGESQPVLTAQTLIEAPLIAIRRQLSNLRTQR
jgi:hypothetical protein